MLVLTRRVGEQILIGDDIVLIITRITNNTVRIGITAPKFVNIVRPECDKPGDVSKRV
jgi:carbon storage regulator CsrA